MVGAGLVGASALSQALAILLGASLRTTPAQMKARDADALERATVALKRIPDLPAAVITDLQEDGVLDEEAVRRLPFETAHRVRDVMIQYHGSRAASGIAGLTVGGIGTGLVLFLLAAGAVGLVGGLLLVARKKVWRCTASGCAFART